MANKKYTRKDFNYTLKLVKILKLPIKYICVSKKAHNLASKNGVLIPSYSSISKLSLSDKDFNEQISYYQDKYIPFTIQAKYGLLGNEFEKQVKKLSKTYKPLEIAQLLKVTNHAVSKHAKKINIRWRKERNVKKSSKTSKSNKRTK